MQLPVAYSDAMKELLKEEYPLYEASLGLSEKNCIRVNTKKISVDDFIGMVPFKLTRIPWIDNGFFVNEEDNLARHPYYFAGLYYIQEASAMTPANRLPVIPGEKVLDLCAAPGGKATELGAKLAGRGLLFANDISNSRAKALLKNLELLGISNICVTSEASQKLATLYPNYFDKILLDAPCSGEGMFRKNPRMIADWQEKGPEFYSVIQKELIELASQMLAPGGQMLYSTCTFSKQENEEVIAHLLKMHPEMRLSEMDGYQGFVKGYDGLDDCVHIFPHKMEGAGHFLALLSKDAHTTNAQRLSDNCFSEALPDEVRVFLKQIDNFFDDGYFKILNDKLYFLPTSYVIDKSLRYLRSGLYVGDIKKNRFEPSQALAMALTKENFSEIVDLTARDIRTIKYLKGETIDVGDVVTSNQRNWQLVCVDGYPLGFGKLQNGILKNKYYSGWRMN